jgi:prepilin-type N-terminal cleavage/methylation domain-containing protein
MKRLRPTRTGFRPAGRGLARGPRTGPTRGDLPGDPRRSGGFSLIELMVVLTVVCLLGAAAAVGWRRNEFKTTYARFVADVEGSITLARNTAIDRQTQVRVDATATDIVVTSFDTVANTWEPVHRVTLDANPSTALVASGSAVCIYGFTPGVQPPGVSVEIDPPSDCLAVPQRLVFEPDGRMTDPDHAFDSVPNAGATMWITDRTIVTTPKYAIIQIFPGGLVRTFKDLE